MIPFWRILLPLASGWSCSPLTLIFNSVKISNITFIYHLRNECKLQVCENGVLTKIFWPKRDVVSGKFRILYAEFHDLYASPSIIRIVEHRIQRGGHVDRIGGTGNAYRMIALYQHHDQWWALALVVLNLQVLLPDLRILLYAFFPLLMCYRISFPVFNCPSHCLLVGVIWTKRFLIISQFYLRVSEHIILLASSSFSYATILCRWMGLKLTLL